MTVFVVVITVLCAVWVVQAALVFKHLGEIEDLASFDPPTPAVWPRVSIVMPARNEAADIASSLESRLTDGYPNLEVIAVDDRSEDDTPRIIAEFAARDERVKTIRIDELPEGWLGKVHALDVGVRDATGEWLLFSDADIEMMPGMLAKAVAHCESEELDLLALVPEFRSKSEIVDVLWAIFIRVFGMSISPKSMRDPSSSFAMGSGSFTLVRRTAFDRTEGFRHLRLETTDDVALGMMVKQAGGRCDFANGRGAVVVSIYDNLAAFYHGAEKNGSSLANTPFPLVAIFVALMTCVEYAPLVAVAVGVFAGIAWLTWVGVLAVLLATASTVAAMHRNTGMVWPALLWPLGWALMASGALRSAWLFHARGGVTWRGTFYSREELLEAQRFRIG